MNIAFTIQIRSKKNIKEALATHTSTAIRVLHPRPGMKKKLSLNCRKAGLITLIGPGPTVIHVILIGPVQQ